MGVPSEDILIYEAIENQRSYYKDPEPVSELDLQTSNPLRRRLDDTGRVFTLQNAYKRIVKNGGFLTTRNTRATKTNTTKAGKDVNKTKGSLFKFYFGPKGVELDVLIRELHAMILTRNSWMNLKNYAVGLFLILAHDKVKVLTAFELWIFFRLEMKKEKTVFLGHKNMVTVVMKNASIRGAFKETNLMHLYTTLVVYVIKVRSRKYKYQTSK
jgi:hypothetical protein